MNATIRRFWDDDSGAEMVEWAVVTIVLLGLTTVAIVLIKDELLEMFVATFNAVQADPPDTYEDT